ISTVNAQYYQKAEQNPFTLVYEGAITENIKGKVNIHPVTYKIKDINVSIRSGSSFRIWLMGLPLHGQELTII
ncbi:MAG: hypothetical protein VB074_18880, partial [Proteiniphilum sp.]|nr:hypothetical protein [Proteiniphilum sp.]